MKLLLSRDFGVSYQAACESDNLDELIAKGEEYDSQLLRWVILDDAGEVKRYCAIHNLNLEGLRQAPGSMFVTGDKFMRRLIEADKAGVVLETEDLVNRVEQERKGLH